MKFGFTTKTILVLLVSLLAGCSQQSSSPTRKPSSVRVHKDSKSALKTSGSNNRSSYQTLSQNKEVNRLMKQCIDSAGGRTSIFVSSLNTNPKISRMINFGSQRAASDIKVFIMADILEMVKSHQLSLSKVIPIHASDVVGGTGVAATKNTSQMTVNQLLELMIKQSDNTATNALIDLAGGLKPINNFIQQKGFRETFLKRKMLDMKALNSGKDNLTSVKDLGTFLTRVYYHQLLGKQFDSKMLVLLTNNVNQGKLPKLVTGANIYNKTGEFPNYGVQNDAAIITKGKRGFIAVVMSENGNQSKQIYAMNVLGKQLAQIFL